MEYGQQMQQAQENAKLAFYQSQGYQFERREKKNLVIDYKQDLWDIASSTLSLPLFEPLIIDKLSDVYIETFTTFNALSGDYPAYNGDKSAFVVDIKEFNINTSTNRYVDNGSPQAQTNIFNKIVIPNEGEGGGTTSTGKTKIHKGRKLNYVCTLNPSTISNLTIKITDLPGTGHMFGNNGRIIFEFVIIVRD
tara:strand:- start:7808 stop:8386 length:579 start_codon:yes stop_codon:yes gene_type:complete